MSRLSLAYLPAVICCSSVAVAVPVDSDDEDGIAVVYVAFEDDNIFRVYILCSNGDVHRLQVVPGSYTYWQQEPNTCHTVPAPVADIADWTPISITTVDGTRYIFVVGGNPSDWYQIGADTIPPAPCEASPVEKASLGGIKTKFK